MSFRILARPLRSLLVKLHPFVSCCASCGEIKVPLEGRLCTSLTPTFFVDGVLVGAPAKDNGTESGKETAEAASLHRRMPWLRRVHAVTEEGALASLTALHTSGVLAEHFFIAFPDSRLARIRGILDIFTPNGMPLLAVVPAEMLPSGEAAWCAFLEKRGLPAGRGGSFASDVYPMTHECLQSFLVTYNTFLANGEKDGGPPPEAYPALARWVFAAAMGVPAGNAHPLAARERT